jgi:hypothetical protein
LLANPGHSCCCIGKGGRGYSVTGFFIGGSIGIHETLAKLGVTTAVARPVAAPRFAWRRVIFLLVTWGIHRGQHLEGQRAENCTRCELISPQGLTAIWSSTWVIPGAYHATRSASSRSIHERTVPFRMILWPTSSTVMRFASNSAITDQDFTSSLAGRAAFI